MTSPYRRQRARMFGARYSEERFEQDVIEFATLHGWRHYHTRRSTGSVAGFPDLILIRGPRIVAAENKVDANTTTAAQLRWLALFAQTGAESVVWRPAGWPRAERWPIVETLDSPRLLPSTGVGDGGGFGAIGQRLFRLDADADGRIADSVRSRVGELDLEPFLQDRT